MKPFADACLRNQAPIAEVLKLEFSDSQTVLEIGSGTGQHAVYVAERLPHLQWQPTELPANLVGIQAWLDESNTSNILPPMSVDMSADIWDIKPPYDAGFTANTVHFVAEEWVRSMFCGFAQAIRSGGVLCVYGPFNRHHAYTSEGNARLDLWLKQRDPRSGIKDFADVIAIADSVGFTFEREHEMPANNVTLVFIRREA